MGILEKFFSVWYNYGINNGKKEIITERRKKNDIRIMRKLVALCRRYRNRTALHHLRRARGEKRVYRLLFGLISTVVAVSLAFMLAQPVLEWTGGLFGLDPLIKSGCVSALGNIEGFNTSIAAADLASALAAKGLPEFLVNAIVQSVGAQELPTGTTLAMVAGEALGAFASMLVSGLIVFVLAKLLLRIVRGVLTRIVRAIPLIGSLNSLLGFVVGALQGLLIVSGILAVLALMPNEGLMSFLSECTVAGWLYNNNPIHVIMGWILV